MIYYEITYIIHYDYNITYFIFLVQEQVALLTMKLEQGGGSVDKPDPSSIDNIDGATQKNAKKCKCVNNICCNVWKNKLYY